MKKALDWDVRIWRELYLLIKWKMDKKEGFY